MSPPYREKGETARNASGVEDGNGDGGMVSDGRNRERRERWEKGETASRFSRET